jgi:hypothetical protein
MLAETTGIKNHPEQGWTIILFVRAGWNYLKVLWDRMKFRWTASHAWTLIHSPF